MDDIIGKVVDGIVIGITDFGAFVRLPSGEKGLVHISNIKDGFVKDIAGHLKINDSIKVRVMSKDKRGNFNLSMKDTNDFPDKIIPKPHNPSGFEKKLAMFLKESEEKISDLKRNIETKRGERKNKR